MSVYVFVLILRNACSHYILDEVIVITSILQEHIIAEARIFASTSHEAVPFTCRSSATKGSLRRSSANLNSLGTCRFTHFEQVHTGHNR